MGTRRGFAICVVELQHASQTKISARQKIHVRSYKSQQGWMRSAMRDTETSWSAAEFLQIVEIGTETRACVGSRKNYDRFATVKAKKKNNAATEKPKECIKNQNSKSYRTVKCEVLTFRAGVTATQLIPKRNSGYRYVLSEQALSEASERESR